MRLSDEEEKRLPVDARERSLAEADLHTSYWVEAGAGTGKTTLLVRRLLNIILTGSARIEEIAAITFTEKAAAELRGRLREALESRIPEETPDRRPLISQALEGLDAASITTIHSFAAGLLRERPVEAGVDPRFRVMDEGELQDLQGQIWERWFDSRAEEEDPLLSRALFLGCTAEQLQQLGLTLYRQRDLVWEADCPEPPDLFPAFLEELTDALPAIERLLPDCRDREDKGYRRLLSLLEQGKAISALKERSEQERYLLKQFKPVAALGNKNNWKPAESCVRQKEICRDLNRAREAACRAVTGRLVSELVRWCRGYLDDLEQAKKESSALDFQDLLLKARNLLLHSHPARAYFQKRFRFIMVDEFQDTDPLQVDLVFFLAEKEPLAADWKDVDPVPGKLFLVGDPKQSIYRFRRADMEIYHAAGAVMRRHGGELAITQNFRTLPGLIAWINRVFEGIMHPQEGVQPQYLPLSAFRPQSSRAETILLEPDGGAPEESAAAVRAAEAEAVAALIDEAVGNWELSAPQEGCRKMTYGDVALLFPTTTGPEIYEDALKKYGVPYRLEGGKQFFQREEVYALKNLLLCIGNPYDRVALAASLRYWAGIPDEDIFLFFNAGFAPDYLTDPGNDYPAIREAFSLFREMHLMQHRLPVSSLVEELLERTWFWHRAGGDLKGTQAAANLRKALQLVRIREQEYPLTLQSLACRLERAAEEARDEAESLLHEAGGDAVQLLTVHKSKGLEFPLVCLVNPGGGRRRGEPFLADRLRRRFYVKIGAGFTSSGYEAALEQEEQRHAAEAIRLFYVAATRARDYLVIPRFYRSRSAGFWSCLERLEEKDPHLWAGCRVIRTDGLSLRPGDMITPGAVAETGPAEPYADPVERLLEERSRFLEELRRVVDEASSPGPYHSASSIFMQDDLDQYTAQNDPDPVSGEAEGSRFAAGRGGASFGSAFHRLMEQASKNRFQTGGLEKAAGEAARLWGVDDLEDLLYLAQTAVNHPLLQRARRAERIFCEVPFILNLQGELIEGLADLVFQENGALVVVDYKTDHAAGMELEALWQRYRPQGEIYALAMAESTGMAVKEVSFLFVRSGTVKSIINPDPARLQRKLWENINKRS